MTIATKLGELLGRTSDAADTTRDQVRFDVVNWSTSVTRDVPAWRDWTARQLGARGFAAMAIECRRGVSLRKHAMALAFEILWEIGGHESPLLSIPAVLTGENELTYWRAIAIAANSER